MIQKNLFSLLIIMLLIPVVSCGTSEQEKEDKSEEQTSMEQETKGVEQETDKSGTESDPENKAKENTEQIEQAKMKSDPKAEKPNPELVAMGADVYKNKGCVACHTIGKGKLVGPDLLGVTERRSEDWLARWMLNPDEMLQTDPIAKEMLKEHLVPMPNQGLTEKEVEALIAYMKHEDITN